MLAAISRWLWPAPPPARAPKPVTPAGGAEPAPPPARPLAAVLSAAEVAALAKPHRHFAGGISWAVWPGGVVTEGARMPARTAGEPATVRRIWSWWGEHIRAAALEFGVPAELIVACIATESAGGVTSREACERARRQEPGWRADHLTPHRVSVGVMQTLISTARAALKRPYLEAADLCDPLTSIRAGTAYIAGQRALTGFDPPLVAAAYNAGGLYEQAGGRWRLRQFPLGTDKHVDRFCQWYGDACGTCLADPWLAPREVSLARLIASRP